MRHIRFLAVLALASTFVIGGARPASAETEGSLDPTFDGDGKVITALSVGNDAAHAVAVQSDGKIVAAGSATVGIVTQVALVRYHPNGSLDSTFSGDGKVFTSIGGTADGAGSVALQPDGKIIVGGSAQIAGVSRFALLRYNTDGSPDTSFSGDGVLTTSMGTTGSSVGGVALQTNGKIVAAGAAYNGAQGNFAVARYNADGSLDATFGGGDGKVTTLIGTDSYADDVALQPDGRIVLAGTALVSGTLEFALARYTATGAPDPTFDLNGVLATPFGSEAHAHGVAVQSNGKIIAGGTGLVGPNFDFALARYNANGSLDTTFSGDGKTWTEFAGNDNILGLTIQRDGKIVGAGYSSGSDVFFALGRYRADGSLDPTFDGDGKVLTAIGTTFDEAADVAIGRDGKIVAAGSTAQPALYDVAVARYIGDAVPPTAGVLLDVPRYTTVLTRTLHWRAIDANVGVKNYDVRYRKAAYSGTSFTAYAPWKWAYPSNAASVTGVPGWTYCFSVRGRDWAGNLGPFGSDRCMAVPVNDRTLGVSGSWTNVTSSAYYLATARRSTSYGATLRLGNVHFRHLALIATTGPTSGTVRVYLGNTLLKTVVLTRPTAHHRVKLPIATSATVRSGTLRIVQVAAGKPVVIEGVGVSLS